MKNSRKSKYLSLFMMFLLLAITACQTESGEKKVAAKSEVPAMTIHQATFMGDTKVLQQHIDAKSDLNAKDEYGSTPLQIATTFGKTEIAKLLIDAGADINRQSADGSTPLHTAAFFCRTEIVTALLEAGADQSLKNNYGSTPLASVEPEFEQVKPIYDQISRDLGPLGLKLDYERLETTRPVIAELLKAHQ